MAKSSWLGIRLDEHERQIIKKKAKDADLNVSEYIRIKCTRDTTGPAIVVDRQTLLELLVSLKRIGNNINQLTHYVHSRRLDDPVENSLVQTLNSLTQTSQELSQFLIDSRNNL